MKETKENTTQSPGLIIKLNILQKRDNALVSIEQYYNSNGRKRSTKSKLKSSIKILMMELRLMLIRYKDWDKMEEVKSFDELDKLVSDEDCENVIRGFKIIDIILDTKRLTLSHNYRTIDTFDLEAENNANHV